MAASFFLFGFLFVVCCTQMCLGENNTATGEGVKNTSSKTDTALNDPNATTTHSPKSDVAADKETATGKNGSDLSSGLPLLTWLVTAVIFGHTLKYLLIV